MNTGLNELKQVLKHDSVLQSEHCEGHGCHPQGMTGHYSSAALMGIARQAEETSQFFMYHFVFS